MGEGDFIMALKAAIRKKIRKEAGAVVNVSLEHHADFKIEMPEDLELCLAQEEGALDYFMSFTKSHQNYFIVWLNTAKTEATRTKRLIMIVDAMIRKYNYAEMLRAGRKT
ncbi:Bacteriocin-protection, YdeI or OmpD-Associated [compost metagenome]